VDATPRTPLLEQERRGAETVALARRWLDAHAGQRTFVWVHVFEPHAPYAPPEPLASRFRQNLYAGDVAAADAALEPLLKPLLEEGSRSGTLVVLTSDHGESLGEHGEATHGVFAYESTLRVPLIVYAPAMLTPRAAGGRARHVDIAPTILAAVGAPLDAKLRGRSLLASAGGRTEQAEPDTYFESLSPALNRGWAPLRGVVRGHLKYIELPIAELYDLEEDPGETRNLAAAREADARSLREALVEFALAPPPSSRVPETADARARLRSLGYASGMAPLRQRYTERDDPKRLMGLDARLQEAVRLHTSGQRLRALAIARGITAERPDMRVAWMTLAQIQRDTGDIAAAVDSMTRAHDLAPEDGQTTALLGAYLIERGNPQAAVAILSPAAAGERPDPQVLVTFAIAQARAGRAADAVATLERARAADPGNARLLLELGTVQLVASRRDAARRTFEEAVARNPALARAHSSLAAMAAEDGRVSDAVSGWREATRLDAGEYRRIFQLGMALTRAPNPAPARACLAFFAEHAPATEYAREIAAARAWLARH
jgi:Tfp pilus assembly protein PilF